ncbi:alginate export family protein [Cupriavidus sp. YAF13]|uniref:alginate export family protein n=1 Tax=Cupriavidus sp. YAF13 TaxID=3233075 RepID=UPI003F8FAD64
MAFGAQRLISIRDAPNVRRSFDGVRLGGTVDRVRLDAFATRPELLRDGVFDGQPNHPQGFWGVYATVPTSVIPHSGFDLYYLGFENDHALYKIGTGVERRHSIGARIFGHRGGWDWDWEALGQFGTFAQQQIRAWGFSTDTGYALTAYDWKPRGGLKVTASSGDRNPHDRTLGTYSGLFPKLAYFNQAGLIGASNVITATF